MTVPNGEHTLRLRARDAADNVGLSDPVSVTVVNTDDEAPTSPTALAGTWGRPSQVALTWSGSTDNGAVTGYRVYRDDEPIKTLGPSARSHTPTSAYRTSRRTPIGSPRSTRPGTRAHPVSRSRSRRATTPHPARRPRSPPSSPARTAAVTWSASSDNHRVAPIASTATALCPRRWTERPTRFSTKGSTTALPTATGWWRSTWPRTSATPAVRQPWPFPTQTAPTAPVDLKAVSTSHERGADLEGGERQRRCEELRRLPRRAAVRHDVLAATSFTDRALVGEHCSTSTTSRRSTRPTTRARRATRSPGRSRTPRPVRAFQPGENAVRVHGQAHLDGHRPTTSACRATRSIAVASRSGRAPLRRTPTRRLRWQDLDLHGPGEGRRRQRERGVEQRQCGRAGGQDRAHDTQRPEGPVGDCGCQADRAGLGCLQRQRRGEELLPLPRQREVQAARERHVVHRHRSGHRQEVHLQGLRDRRGRQLERSVRT